MQRYETLKQRSTFVSIAKQGKRFFGETFLIQVFPCELLREENFRVGYVASRKVGNAVRRNKAKRRLRELVRAYQTNFLSGFDYVFVARSTMWDQSFDKIKLDFEQVLEKVVKAYA